MGLKERVQELCQQKGITAQQAEIKLEFAKGSISKLNLNTPTAAKIQKIADYFEVPLDFLLGRSPFEHWEQINQNRQGFLRYVDEEADILDLVWGIDSKHPETAPVKDFISMLATCVETAVPNGDGSWAVKMRPSYQSKEKAPTQEGERTISDKEIMFALWGDTTDVDEDDLEDVKRYAAFVRERKKKS